MAHGARVRARALPHWALAKVANAKSEKYIKIRERRDGEVGSPGWCVLGLGFACCICMMAVGL
jgi:hypothetical protein